MSVASKDSEQGKVMGASQSAASLGRILGPILGGWLYTNYGMGSPFWAAGLVTLIGFLAIIYRYSQLPDQAEAKADGKRRS